MYGPYDGPEISGRAFLSRRPSLDLTGHITASVNTSDLASRQAIFTNEMLVRLHFGNSIHGESVNSIIVGVGVKSRPAQSDKKNQQDLVVNVENSRQSPGGVSLDNETAKMILCRQVYWATAMAINAMHLAWIPLTAVREGAPKI